MPLVFLPEPELLFLWGPELAARELDELRAAGVPHAVTLVTPDGPAHVDGLAVSLLPALEQLARTPVALVPRLSGSGAAWTLAGKLAVDLVSRERIIPTIARRRGRVEARWAAALAASEDAARVAALARSLPPAAHAVPVSAEAGLAVWAPEALLRAFLDAAVDALVRASRGSPAPPRAPRARGGAPRPLPWDQRWRSALAGAEPGFEPQGFAERSLLDDLDHWSEPLLGRGDRLRACFRLEVPEADREVFVLRFLLQSPDDPSLLVPASEIWRVSGQTLQRFGRAFRNPQESLLSALGRAALSFEPLELALAQPAPEAIELDPHAAWKFLGDGAAALTEAGFGIILPSELTPRGARRLRLRMRVGGTSKKVAGAVSGVAGLGLDELLRVDYGALLGDEPLSAKDLAELARRKAPLVRFRGAWVAVDPRELAEIRRRMEQAPASITLREAVQAALAGESRQGEFAAAVVPAGPFAELLERLRESGQHELPPPEGLRATLRPYQRRGQSWLSNLSALGLGACLADDMGLGKTMQLLAHLLRRAEVGTLERRPALLVAPTSVLGNWEREVERFAPTLALTRHYGGERAREPEALARAGDLVITSYSVLRRDAGLLAAVDWTAVALDEAQSIKNAASQTARAARGLRARERFALTGTPVENRLAELWSIFEFINPGLLGPLEKFRRDFAVPIERHGNETAARRLRSVTSPFILRRLKSDPSVIDDLPAKSEAKVVCTLTREQASLYKAVVDEELSRIEKSDAMERRGRVLALLTATKQICNHPAQYLGEKGPLAGRSGKLARVTEMLEEVVLAGDKALVFTQFREMGERLVQHLGVALGREVLFLHGATSKAGRDALVQRFQEDVGAPIFVLSLKAGGTGLNLTAASHVFHFDRWWNPAVEDQATDRAYRIGQRRAVVVHKLVCAGTVEDKVDQLLERKRRLASSVVAAGERWITELAADELRDLFALSGSAVVDSEDGDEGASEGPARPPRAAARTRRKART